MTWEKNSDPAPTASTSSEVRLVQVGGQRCDDAGGGDRRDRRGAGRGGAINNGGVVLQWAGDALAPDGNEVRQVRATGGFARSPGVAQMLADVSGLDVHFTATHEGSSFGAALLGMQALGRVASVEVAADLVQVESTVRPEPAAAATYELYDALSPAFRTLRRLGPGLPRE